MKQIFEPVKMNHIELKNRLIRSATWEGIANPDGSVTSEAYEIYEELAKGGIGAIITDKNHYCTKIQDTKDANQIITLDRNLFISYNIYHSDSNLHDNSYRPFHNNPHEEDI